MIIEILLLSLCYIEAHVYANSHRKLGSCWDMYVYYYTKRRKLLGVTKKDEIGLGWSHDRSSATKT